MPTYQLFVGSDNLTHRVDDDTLTKILDSNHDGYTVATGDGVWQGQREDTRVITVADDESKIRETIREIKDLLRQESVGFIELPDMQFA